MLRAGSRVLRQLALTQQLGGPATGFRQVHFLDAPNGPAVSQVPIEDEWYNRQRPLMGILHSLPSVEGDTWIAPNAVVAGDVDLYERTAIFFGAVVRGDLNKIRIGANSVVLDRSVIHAARAVPTGLNPATIIDNFVTIEPHCVLRSCRIEPKVLIGARSVVCEGAIVESESILTPGSVVPPARRIPSGELWGGNPIKFIRKLTGNERERVIVEAAEHYLRLADLFRQEELPCGTQWREVEAWRAKLVAAKEYQWVNYREQKYLIKVQEEAVDASKLVQ